MFIDTTICIHDDILKKLEEASISTGLPRRCLISCLIKYASQAMPKGPSRWRRVKYQERRKDSRWRRIHVLMRGDEYEFFDDMRKFCKMSISHLIAFAVINYLDEILEKVAANPDNYLYRNYAFTQYCIDDVVCWIIYWGLPETLLAPPPD